MCDEMIEWLDFFYP